MAANEVERVDWRLAHIYEADCYYEMGSFAAALQRYQEAAGLYKDFTTSLAAYVQIINCHVFLGQREDAASALARALVLVETVPQEAFTRSVSPEDRQDWKRYFSWLAATELF